MTKFQKLLHELDKLKLPKDKYVIFGSGLLAAKKIRESDDLDIVVTPDLWDKLIKKYKPQIKEFEPQKKVIKIGKIEFGKNYSTFKDTKILFKNSELIKRHRFVNMKYLIKWKKALGRDKDKKDLQLIEKYLRKQLLHVFIDGGSGTGKTTLARFFKKHGKNAFDGDRCVGKWIDKNGKTVKVQYKEIGKNINKWANRHKLTWTLDKDKFEKLLKANKNKELYLFGGPTPKNLNHFFDKIFWLNADKELILKRIKLRLKDKNSYHKLGETRAQREKIIHKLEAENKDAIKDGYELVDASLTPKKIFEIIING